MFDVTVANDGSLKCYNIKCDSSFTKTILGSSYKAIIAGCRVIILNVSVFSFTFCEKCGADIYEEAKIKLNPVLWPFK